MVVHPSIVVTLPAPARLAFPGGTVATKLYADGQREFPQTNVAARINEKIVPGGIDPAGSPGTLGRVGATGHNAGA